VDLNKKSLLTRIAVFSLGALILSGCSAPSKIYAADKKEGVFVALPQDWHRISQQSISSREATSTLAGAADRAAAVLWQEAYSPNKTYDAKTVLSLKTPDSPLVYIRVRSLLGDEINSVSYNALRNLVLPLTGWVDGSVKAPVFDISNDEERVEKGARGVHSVFQFTQTDGSLQTIDQTALLSNDHSIIYILLIRCSTTCYNKQRVMLEKIVASFTVRGKK
jgi:hypothetical protein